MAISAGRARMCVLAWAGVVCAFFAGVVRGESLGAGALGGNRYRVIVSSDIGGGDEDDIQSMIHYLLYSDLFDTEGLISSPPQQGRAADILKVIDVYEKDYSRLRAASGRYPSPSHLRSIAKQGATDPAPEKGYGEATEGSRWIVECAGRADERPLYVLVWGAVTDVAQAVHDEPSIKEKIRVHFIASWNQRQDENAFAYIDREHSDTWLIHDDTTFRGWYMGGEQGGEMGNRSFVEAHIKGHGALGDYFAPLKGGSIKMGDTPTAARLLRGTPEDPTKESWGGQFVKMAGRKNWWVDSPADELKEEGRAGAKTVNKWRADYLRDFEKRMDRAAGTGGAAGPLRVCVKNPRYFADGEGRAVYLTGSHTWNNLVDMGRSEPPEVFDYERYLDWMEELDHNFIRMWAWEAVTWDTKNNRREGVNRVYPQPWARTGPGEAADGKARYDLTKYDGEYFGRLRHRVEEAGKRGIYVSVMLFEGWAMQFSPGAWEGHPFNAGNNVNGIDGDVDGDGNGLEVHELVGEKILAMQEAYVRKVIETVNDLDNVLYEISNENHPKSTEWQYHMVRFMKGCEKSMAKQHPVGMTFQYKGGSNEALFASPADWISPNPGDGSYRNDPPVADGRKVVLLDTDHLWGIGGNVGWVWKSFARGHNPLFMDPYDDAILGEGSEGKWDSVRRSLGYTRSYAERMNLAEAAPQPELASTGYCLAQAGREYLVYRPAGGGKKVTVRIAAGRYSFEWFDVTKGEAASRGSVEAGGGDKVFDVPFDGDAVLYLKAD